MTDVEALGVNAQEPFHAGDKVGFGCFDDEVKMVSHQTPGVDLPAGFGAGFSQRVQEAVEIAVVPDDVLALIAAAHQLVNGAWISYPELARHAVNLLKSGAERQ